jgi:hypothetical protein
MKKPRHGECRGWLITQRRLSTADHTRLEQAAKLLEAAGEELLAEEADGLAERVDLAEAAVRH